MSCEVGEVGRSMSVFYGNAIWILFDASIYCNDGHEEVQGIAKEAVEELEKKSENVIRS